MNNNQNIKLSARTIELCEKIETLAKDNYKAPNDLFETEATTLYYVVLESAKFRFPKEKSHMYEACKYAVENRERIKEWAEDCPDLISA